MFAILQLRDYQGSEQKALKGAEDYVIEAVQILLLNGEFNFSRATSRTLFKALAVIIAELIRQDLDQVNMQDKSERSELRLS
jgi:hypothetical protein